MLDEIADQLISVSVMPIPPAADGPWQWWCVLKAAGRQVAEATADRPDLAIRIAAAQVRTYSGDRDGSRDRK